MTQNKYVKRYLEGPISDDLVNKIILLSGPRQCGKTSLSSQLKFASHYLNYDNLDDRKIYLERSWDRSKELIIFDELHKMTNWKSWLKGVYDKEKSKNKYLVTGSARLDLAKKVGDSLAGRFFPYRLHPFDLKELALIIPPHEAFKLLMTLSGFPEPLFSGSERFYRKWRSAHLDIILRQDLIDLTSVSDISTIESLIVLLQDRVGKQISYANLARDLQKDPKTIKSWLQLLEDLFIIFKVPTYSQKITNAILKEPKYYFYDLMRVKKDSGEKLENLVALSLIKEIDYIQDTQGFKGKLFYLRNKQKQEVDFLVMIEEHRPLLIEVKQRNSSRSKDLTYFMRFFENPRALQLVQDINQEKTYEDDLEVRSLIHWSTNMNLTSSLQERR